MAEEDVRIRVPREDSLLLKALAYARGMCVNDLLGFLIRKEAEQNGVDSHTATKLVESGKKDAPEIAVKIRQTRLKQGLTQEAFGRIFSLSQANVALIESGQRDIPRRALNAILSWLTDKSNLTPPPSDPPQLHEE